MINKFNDWSVLCDFEGSIMMVSDWVPEIGATIILGGGSSSCPTQMGLDDLFEFIDVEETAIKLRTSCLFSREFDGSIGPPDVCYLYKSPNPPLGGPSTNIPQVAASVVREGFSALTSRLSGVVSSFISPQYSNSRQSSSPKTSTVIDNRPPLLSSQPLRTSNDIPSFQ